ncbi:MAG: DNA-processing protein DprA [Ruminococcaceae bacterium]|nr:DNA-processing protein DprA [Oscillospiraceae bacterium]
MRGVEQGFLLLTCPLGDPQRQVLTTAQFRTLAKRVSQTEMKMEDRELTKEDVVSLGYGSAFAERILALLSQEDLLKHYLYRCNRAGCQSISRLHDAYPLKLRKSLGLDSPGSLWAKGDLSLLKQPMIALVGSRELNAENAAFARQVGIDAARQGYVLVSGNARGADKTAQNACLQAGGRVISVLADELEKYPVLENLLYLAEDGFDLPFTAQRALSRNRVIHGLADKTFVAQVTDGRGGTWDGTVKNLRFGWSNVFCFNDSSAGATNLIQMGATPVEGADLQDLSGLTSNAISLFDQ